MEINFDDMMELIVRGFEVGAWRSFSWGHWLRSSRPLSRTGGLVDVKPMRLRVATSGAPFSWD